MVSGQIPERIEDLQPFEGREMEFSVRQLPALIYGQCSRSHKPLVWAWCGLGAVVLALAASVFIGSLVPVVEESRTVGGRWYWIVSDGTHSSIRSKDQDRCGVAVYVGLDESVGSALGVPLKRTKRVWTIDPNLDLRNEEALRAVFETMTMRDGLGDWAGLLLGQTRSRTRPDWVGRGVFGAIVLLPASFLGLGLLKLGKHWHGQIRTALDQRRQRCTCCGYALRGLDVFDAPSCPECGTIRSEARSAA